MNIHNKALFFKMLDLKINKRLFLLCVLPADDAITLCKSTQRGELETMKCLVKDSLTFSPRLLT